MNKIFLIISTLLLSISLFSQERELTERESRVNDVSKVATKNSPRPYIGSFARGGGGGPESTDCYSFVPVPDDAIELDENAINFGNSLDGAWGPFDLGFDFCHFGTTYNQFYINIKGNITFGASNVTFTPQGFPAAGPEVTMIAGFWADVDLRCGGCGTAYYWTTPTAAYITFEEVGYFNNHSDLTNTFQIVITDQTDEVVGIGNNVGLFYRDMQWAVGDDNGGVGGFGGNASATVGANKNDGDSFLQFGRFSTDNDNYDGPFGGDDGVHWLDDKAFVFNLCSSAENLPPIISNNDACDTVFICQNDLYDFDLSFIAPEPDQGVTVTVDDSGADGWTETSNSNGAVTGVFEGGPGNIGNHTLVFTATDDGTPTGITSVTYNIVVKDITLPDLTVTGDGFTNNLIFYCNGEDGSELTASAGFDSYLWSSVDSVGQTTLLQEGEYIVQGNLEGCVAEFGPFFVFEKPNFNPAVNVEDFFICAGETTEISVQDPEDYSGITWSIFNGFGEIVSPDVTAPTVTVTPGVYEISVLDNSGCPGRRIVPVEEDIINIPPTSFAPLCDGNDEITWNGAWADPEECAHFIYLFDLEGDTWEGANLQVFIDGNGPLNYNISNGSFQIQTGILPYHGQLIEYYWESGADDDDIRLQLFDGDNDIVFDTDNGDQLVAGSDPFFAQFVDCGFNPLPGTWSVVDQDGNSGPLPEFTDVFNPVNGSNTFTAPAGFNGTYTLSFESAICDSTHVFDLTFSEVPTISVSDYQECNNANIAIEPDYNTISELQGEAEIDYDWSPGNDCDGSPTCIPETSEEYTIEVSNSLCFNTNTFSFSVDLIPEPIVSLNDATLCDGASEVLDPLLDDHPTITCEWSTGEDTSTLTVSDTGTYTVRCTNDCGSQSATSEVGAANTPTVFYVSDTLICTGEEIDIAPVWNGLDGNAVNWSFSWIDASQTTVFNALSETGNVLTFGADQIPLDAQGNAVTIFFETSNVCGQASGNVYAFLEACFLGAYNVITPDNDNAENSSVSGPTGLLGLNEGWQIEGIDGLSNVHVRIFDRWGNLVFEEESYQNSNPWRGRHSNGNDLQDGVYFYTVSTPTKEDALQGSVTVLRKK